MPVSWREATDAGVLSDIADQLMQTRCQPPDPATAFGRPVLFGGELLNSQPDCWRLTLDLSGDGKSNIGPDVIVENATVLEDFQSAMARKLLREPRKQAIGA